MPLKHDSKADTLRQWIAKGVTSPTIDARLRYTDAEGFHRYAMQLHGKGRVFPNMLPTQASGRWSTTAPPLVNFPPSMDDTIIPDEGTYWIGWDLDGIEGRLGSAFMRDTADLEAWNNAHDLHTLTACRAWGKPLPPILTKKLHTDPSCEEWRQSWSPVWGYGQTKRSDDRRRHLAKIARYALQYVKPTHGQERAILLAKDIEKQGLDREKMVEFARMYLKSKPVLTQFKLKMFQTLNERGEARTIFGRRRRLFGEYWTKGKEGWSFMVSGSVSDIMNQAFIEIQALYPQAWLIKNGHDAGIWAFPVHVEQSTAVDTLRRVVNRTWDVNGVNIYCPGEFYIVSSAGIKQAV